MVEAAAKAGFNVFSPRQGHDRLDEVRQVTQWCRENGIFHMPWMRGSLKAPMTEEAAGRRFLCDTGLEQPIWSPNSDEFWDWTSRYVLAYAKISRDNPHLIGVFLDYENYFPGRKEAGNLYRLSYDDSILARFAKSRKIELPVIEPAQRKAWLQEKRLHEAFQEFQIDHWRTRCRTLRREVDELNPKFQFCIYPAPGTLLMTKACYPEWATRKAPLILADASTYGRSGRLTSQKEALQINRSKLVERRKMPLSSEIPFLYTGGIDPAVRGADPEFCGKNAVAISEVTDGYWVFYEGTKYDEGHPQYWKWFRWANRHIADGNYRMQYEPRETPENWFGDTFQRFDKKPNLELPEPLAKETDLPRVLLRHENLLVLACQKGKPVKLTLANVPVGKYIAPLVWEIRDESLTRIASAEIAHDKTEEITFTPKRGGLHILAATSGVCAWAVLKTNVPIGLCAGDKLRTIRGASRLYFHVPKTARRFAITLEGAGVETVRGNVFDAQGRPIAGSETDVNRSSATIEVRRQDREPGIWSLELTRATTGVLEDQSVVLHGDVAPVLSLTPEHVFTARPSQ
jgi:hypothetical protein